MAQQARGHSEGSSEKERRAAKGRAVREGMDGWRTKESKRRHTTEKDAVAQLEHRVLNAAIVSF